jgi:CspA family cold shock protein
LQGVIKSYDPGTGDGLVLCDSDYREYELAPDAMSGSVLRMVRQGQRVIFELDERGLATGLHLGSEVDMGTPGFPPSEGQGPRSAPPPLEPEAP